MTRPSASRRVLLALCILGAALRIAEYVARRSLWLDEAMLANDIVGRTFATLLRPLDDHESGPWLFLWIEHALALVGGTNELALRLLPLLAGLALPPLTWLVGRRLAGDRAALVAVALVALSPLLVYYANEVKPYGLDPLVAIAMAAATVAVLEEPASNHRWRVLSIGGVASLALSFPAAFVIAACWLALAADSRLRSTARMPLALTAAAWSVAFVATYLLFVRGTAQSDYMQTAFVARFLVPWEPGGIAHFWGSWRELVVATFFGWEANTRVAWLWPVLPVVAMGLAVAGVVATARARSLPRLIILLAPTALAIVASSLRLYPATPRIWTFAAPFWALVLGAGVGEVAGWLARGRAAVAAAAAAMLTTALLLPPAFDALTLLRNPYSRRDHLRPLIEALRERQRATGEPVYVSAHAVAQWLFYTAEWRGAVRPPSDRDGAATWLDEHTCRGNQPCQILGAYSGVRYIEGKGFIGDPAAGWARAEVARLRARAAPCGWILLYHAFPGEPKALADAVAGEGGSIESALRDDLHYNREFPSTAYHACFAAVTAR